MQNSISGTAALPPGTAIGPMRREEASILGDWAAAAGWNPGLADIAVAWGYDPDAFIALRKGDTLIGGGAIMAYGRTAGFMGLFIMHPEWRQQGLGRCLWHERLRRLRARLDPAAPIGMDGVFEMVPFYEAGGFRSLHRDLRFEGVAEAGMADPAVEPLAAVPAAAIAGYDAAVTGLSRPGFLGAWLGVPGGYGVALREGGQLRGYGFARPCQHGVKIGPLLADTPAVAERLLGGLLAARPGVAVALDVPEPNAAALAMVRARGWREAFGCARMESGGRLPVDLARVFGVTSFEFG
jgi:GNAT superfamily N-acetyltransferase